MCCTPKVFSRQISVERIRNPFGDARPFRCFVQYTGGKTADATLCRGGEDGGSVRAATAFVFGSGTAGTRRATRDGRGFGRDGYGFRCRRQGRIDRFGYGGRYFGLFQFVKEQLTAEVALEDRRHVLATGEAERGSVEFFRDGLVADLALGLEAAEFGGGSLKVAQGLGAGTVDRVLGVSLPSLEIRSRIRLPHSGEGARRRE